MSEIKELSQEVFWEHKLLKWGKVSSPPSCEFCNKDPLHYTQFKAQVWILRNAAVCWYLLQITCVETADRGPAADQALCELWPPGTDPGVTAVYFERVKHRLKMFSFSCLKHRVHVTVQRASSLYNPANCFWAPLLTFFTFQLWKSPRLHRCCL